MVTPIYSAQIFESAPVPIGLYTFTPQAPNDVFVIRSMEFTNFTSFAYPSDNFYVVLGGFRPLWYPGPGRLVLPGSFHWRGRAVFLGTDALSVQTQDDNWAWVISGFHFKG